MRPNIFQQLREQLDQYAFGFPPTESGIEIELLKLMFNEEQAFMFTNLTAELESPKSIACKINRPVEEVSEILGDMAQKGLLFRQKRGNQLFYSAIPFIHGLLEFQVNRLGRKMVKMAGDYINQIYKHNMARNTQSFMRTIPVQRSLDLTHKIAPYEDAREILRGNKDLIVITECACRQQKVLFNKGCGKPMEVCFMFGPMGQYYIDNGLGHQITLSEAYGILDKVQELGLITQPASSQKPFTMCNCCVDCCGFLRAILKYPKPAQLIFSNYNAIVDQDKCSGCRICVTRCPMVAVKMNSDGYSVIDGDRCIGCGLCVTTCRERARRLIRKSEQPRVPPADTTDQFMEMARKRGLTDIKPSQIVSYGFEVCSCREIT